MDSFTLTVSAPRQIDNLTKRTMLSDISRVFDALGWFSPTTIQMKVIIQRTWELDIGWDDQVPEHILDKWKTWRSELPVLSNIHLQRYLYLKEETPTTTQLHGFSDASEEAYRAVVYMRSSAHCIDHGQNEGSTSQATVDSQIGALRSPDPVTYPEKGSRYPEGS